MRSDLGKLLRVSYPVLVLAPLVMWRLHAMSATRPVASPVWLAATIGGPALYAVASAFVVEWRFLKEPVASRLKARGTVPENAVTLIGLTAMLSPASWAFLAAFIGLPTTQLAWYAVLSTFGVGFWGWRYRHVIYAT